MEDNEIIEDDYSEDSYGASDRKETEEQDSAIATYLLIYGY